MLIKNRLMGLLNTKYSLNSWMLYTLTIISLSACGPTPSQSPDSQLDFVRSRPNSQRYAYLEPKDTEDTFLFGAGVIKTTNFKSGALNMTIRPMEVKLSPSDNDKKLDVVTADDGKKVLSFDLSKNAQRLEVDFASSGNDLNLRSIIDTVGGMTTAESKDGMWVSTGAPKVLNVSQDADTMVVDLEHTVKQARTVTDFFGRTRVVEITSAEPGEVVVRLFLKRQKSLPRLGDLSRTVALGKSLDVGFFGPDLRGSEEAVPVQRHNLGDAAERARGITYYLKDVPAAYQATAREAVLSWNKAFDGNVLSVEIAPDGVDVGDPRYSVIKWFDGTDNSLGWAGVAKMIVDPATGLVMSGSLYIQGDTLIKLYGDIVTYSETVTKDPLRHIAGRIGNIDFSVDTGEQPVAPFLTDVSRNFADYMKHYYLETIAHEVGHTLGLRHNFRGSTQLSGDASASVMDYAPRAERDNYQGPGFYDIAAIRWGYFGEKPTQKLPFCTDEDIWKLYDCNQGDWGDAIDNTLKGLIEGTMLLAQKPQLITRDEQISSMGGSLENAYKIKKLISQLPADKQAQALINIDATRDYVFSAKVDDSLSAGDQEKAKKNLAKLRELATKTEDRLRQAGRL